MLEVLSRQKRIVVCVGPGGVGKTTTAAALGALAARQGRRTLVCTIDPAPRLADALGVGSLGAEPRPIPPEASRALGIDREDNLSAVRLDTQRAFAGLVEEQVSDAGMRDAHLLEPDLPADHHRAVRLAGVRGDAGALRPRAPAPVRSHRARHAAHAERARLPGGAAADRRRGLQPGDPVVRAARDGGKSASTFSFQRLRSGSAIVIRRLAKFVGSQFLDDVGAFLVDFRDVLGGFLDRARQIETLLRSADVGFLLVLAPEVPAVNEALYFHARLREAGIPLGAFVANRVHQPPGDDDASAIARRLARATGGGGAGRKRAARGGADAGGGGARPAPAVRVGAARAGSVDARGARRAPHRGAALRARDRQPGWSYAASAITWPA